MSDNNPPGDANRMATRPARRWYCFDCANPITEYRQCVLAYEEFYCPFCGFWYDADGLGVVYWSDEEFLAEIQRRVRAKDTRIPANKLRERMKWR